MSQETPIPDQDDVLVTNARLQADNTRLKAENARLTTDLAVQSKAVADAAQASAAEAAAAKETVTRLQAENAALTAKMADFQKAVAAEVVKLGLNPKAAEHKPAPVEKDLTPTQRVLLAKGVSSLEELRRMRSTG